MVKERVGGFIIGFWSKIIVHGVFGMRRLEVMS